MTHEEIKVLISAYIDGEVTPSEKNIVEEHVSACPSCQKDLKMYKAMSSSLSKWADETLSADEAIKVQKHFEQRREPMFTKRTAVIFATTLSLALIVGSLLQINLQREGQSGLNSIAKTNSVQYSPAMGPRSANIGTEVLYKPQYMQSAFMGNDARTFDQHATLASSSATLLNTVYYASEPVVSLKGSNYYRPYFPTNEWYYPQPTPAESYRIQNAASNTEQYDRIDESPFLEAKENPLSTFSIDVDTGSYSNIRRFLFNGQMPPKDAVHIEEMINYFHYDYPQPKWDGPFSITTEMAPCPWNRLHNLVLVGLQGKRIPMENLPASNLVFLVDVSGSMAEQDKLPLVKSALHLLVEQLRLQDKVSIAVFAGSATRLLEATSGRDKDKIENAIDSLEADGSTNGEDGLQLAYKIAKENFIPNGNNRIIVTTDGDFNVGTSDDSDLVRMIEEKWDQGVYLSVFGFGMGNIKASRMEKLADAGHGNYDYIDSLDEARKEFVQQLGGTLYAIAKDVKIQVEFNPVQVKAYRLIGYEQKMLNKEDFNNDKKEAGVIGSGHTVTALYEIVPASSGESFNKVDVLKYQATTPTSSSAVSGEVMTIKLRYKEPKSKNDKSKLIVKTIKNDEISSPGYDNLRFAASVAEFGMLLRGSTYKGTASYLGVMTEARLATGEDKDGYRGEFLQMVEKAGLLNADVKSQNTSQ